MTISCSNSEAQSDCTKQGYINTTLLGDTKDQENWNANCDYDPTWFGGIPHSPYVVDGYVPNSQPDSNSYDSENDYPEEYDDNSSSNNDDYSDFEEPCIGDCTDMDHDGRTSNDIDADGDGRYESD